MNDRQLRYILEIAKEGSVTAAAENLHISQPSLSALLSTVENENSAKLFDRSVTPLVLTWEGEQYIQAAAKILGTMREFQAKLDDLKDGISGRVNIGCGPQHSPFIIPVILPVLIKKYPQVQFRLTEDYQSHLDELLLNGILDVMICFGNSGLPNINYIPLNRDEVLLLTPEDFIPKRLKKARDRAFPFFDISQLGGKPFALMKKHHRMRSTQDVILKENGCVPNVILETDSWQTCLRLVESGVAFTLLPNISSESFDIHTGTYSLEKDYGRTLYLCYRKNVHYTRTLDEFVKTTISLLQNE
jgi:DNA-binding transcriptional LysR family regulator